MGGRAVEVMGLGKRYVLGEDPFAYDTLRDALARSLRRLGRGRAPPRPREEIWPLRGVAFDVAEGEAVGVIGRNGAGKTTLLKILARITEPTEGLARTRGRVGCLLEVGTGFHPELTGRENVHLNGAIIGMTRREVARRFDEIVAFAGVERFLDTPVKRYSSGMYLRLAFAVAAHFEPEILVVDEILAVGDVEFQRRCLKRLSTISVEGRTVLFVSHDLDAIQRLCRRALWLEGGTVKADGPSSEVVERYLASGLARGTRTFPDDGRQPVVLRAVEVRDARDRPHPVLRRDDPLRIAVRFFVRAPVPGLDLSLLLFNVRGVRVLDEAVSDGALESLREPGEYAASVVLPPILNVGDYTLGVWFGTPYEGVLYVDDAAGFRLEGGARGRAERLLQLAPPWTLERLDLRDAGPADGPLRGEGGG